MEELISLEDVVVAYRKAKADSFFNTGHLTSLDFATYEENLSENLTSFLSKVNSEDLQWVTETKFLGGFNVILKSVNVGNSQPSGSSYFFSNFERSWSNLSDCEIDFRILGKHSVEFHILSSLWIESVGKILEEQMSPNSYGCRLITPTRRPNKEDDDIAFKSLAGHFRPYIKPYLEWQENGIKKIKTALANGTNVIAVTADLTKYYHRIDCSFIEDDLFLNLTKDFSSTQKKLNKLLVTAIRRWSHNVFMDPSTPVQFKYNNHSGIPIGLGASKVIANLLLTYFDTKVEQEIKPIYYGRYVDDIFLVIEDGGDIRDEKDFWYFLCKRLDGLTPPSQIEDEISPKEQYSPKGFIYHVPYSKNSLLEFGKEKAKFFFLEGDSGAIFMKALEESLEENSSEWNLPPNAKDDLDNFSRDVSSATSDNSEPANGLRKSNGLSLKRMKLILYLSRFEAATDLLPKSKWQHRLTKFLSLIIEYCVTPRTLPIYSKYFPRVIALATKTGNIEQAKLLYTRIEDAFKALKKCSYEFPHHFTEELIERSWLHQKELLIEGVYFGFPVFDDIEAPDLSELDSRLSIDSIRKISRLLFNADLHKTAYKEIFMLEKRLPVDGFFQKNEQWMLDLYSLPVWSVFKKFANALLNSIGHGTENHELPKALYFYTRRFTLLELTLIFPKWYDDPGILQAACTLFKEEFVLPKTSDVNGKYEGKDYIQVSFDGPNQKPDKVFAFTSLETKLESWKALVRKDGSEPDIDREQRILDLCRDILKCKRKRIDYVVFPELSLPRKMILYVANKFRTKNISIIAGIEYKFLNGVPDLPSTFTGYVSNQLLYILSVKGNHSVRQVALTQYKLLPALEEEHDLFSVGGLLLKPEHKTKFLINHGNFWFSGLICNDFLDIENRALLRGAIDALIIIEWNKDVNTYNALVESSANDIHAFIVQVNNRLYGDTRLRAPYKESYKRDQVRVRGGELDYFVIATLPVQDLRLFQSHHRSPESPFKPVPTGFEIESARKYRPPSAE